MKIEFILAIFFCILGVVCFVGIIVACEYAEEYLFFPVIGAIAMFLFAIGFFLTGIHVHEVIEGVTENGQYYRLIDYHEGCILSNDKYQEFAIIEIDGAKFYLDGDSIIALPDGIEK